MLRYWELGLQQHMNLPEGHHLATSVGGQKSLRSLSQLRIGHWESELMKKDHRNKD